MSSNRLHIVSGWVKAKVRKTGWVSMRARSSVPAVTVADRRFDWSMRAISPKNSPGPRVRTAFPFTETVAWPSAMIVVRLRGRHDLHAGQG